MIKLHGIGGSNYYSLAKACVLEKGMAFEEVTAPPSQDEGYLVKSPMGKVPCIETESGFISETFAIADYLDQIQPEKPLLPAQPFARAKAIELCRHLELDVELVARRCLPAAFFGAGVSDEVKASTAKDLKRGMKAVTRLIVCDPYIAGHEFCLADIYTFYVFGLSSAIVQKIFNEDLLEDLPQVKTLIGKLANRDCIAEVEAAKSG
ncbi:MAG: glutathione S-transferase [Pseudomonadales bacterium]